MTSKAEVTATKETSEKQEAMAAGRGRQSGLFLSRRANPPKRKETSVGKWQSSKALPLLSWADFQGLPPCAAATQFGPTLYLELYQTRKET